MSPTPSRIINQLQERIAKAIVNIFETGHIAGDYSSVTLLKGDPGHLTYGRSQTTLASGNLFLLVRAYCERPDAQFAAALRPFLPKLALCDTILDTDITFRDTLKEAGHHDSAMRSEQDRFFDTQYFAPACRTAQSRSISTALGITVIYDSFIQGGFRKVVPLVGCEINGDVDERTWIQKYIEARRGWIRSLNDPLAKTAYRMDAFSKLVSEGAWDLSLNLTVHGSVISPETLDNMPQIVRVAAVDPGDPPPASILHLTSPYIQGEEVRRVQVALNTLGFNNAGDGIYGPFTEALVKSFQNSRGMKADGIVGPATMTALGL